MKTLPLLFALLLVCSLASCYTMSNQFTRLQLGMSKEAVTAALGNPDIVRGSMQNKYGAVIEVWSTMSMRTGPQGLG